MIRHRLAQAAGALMATVFAVGVLGVTPALGSEQLAFIPAAFSPFGPSGPGTFSHPAGVAVNENTGELFVTDGNATEAVDIFDAQTGALLGSITGTGSETFDFGEEPAGVAIDQADGRLYVSDVEHNVVDEFERTGAATYRYVCQFNGWYGTGVQGCHASGGTPDTNEEFKEPLGVAVDTQGDLYIASYGPEGGAVDEFDQTGEGIQRIAGSEHPTLRGHPDGIVVSATGDIFVVNYEKGREIAELQRKSLTGPVEGERALESGIKAIAGNLVDGDLYVDDGTEVERYVPSGAGGLQFEDEFGERVLGLSEGLAVDAATHTIYVSDRGDDQVEVYQEKLVTLPDIQSGCKASMVSARGLTLGGELDPLGQIGASYTFEYTPLLGLEPPLYVSQTPSSPVAGGLQEVSATLNGLEPGTLYHCRLSASDSEAEAGGLVARGPDSTVETPPLAPAVGEAPVFASRVTSESAVLGGAVNPGSSTIDPDRLVTTSYHFAYGTQAGRYTTALPEVVGVGVGLEAIPVEQAIPAGALQPATTYHFALIATNSAGTVVGEDHTFTTPSVGGAPSVAPSAQTGAATGVSTNGATLTGTLDSGAGPPALYEFELGPTSAYGTVLYGGEAGPGGEPQSVSLEAPGLAPGALYHYRLCATNTNGTTCGADATFTTDGLPVAIIAPASPSLIAFATPSFPKELLGVVTGNTKSGKARAKKHATRKQQLADALRSCRRRPRAQRSACKRAVRERFAAQAHSGHLRTKHQ